MTDFEPSLAYAGTSGSVDVDTSRDATYHADTTGITNRAQRYVLSVAAMMREKGVTVAELREKDGTVHHGRVSAALTNLHIAGRLVALRERRNHCGVYVLPEFQNGREARAYKPNRKPIDEEIIRGVLLGHRYDPDYTYNRPDLCSCNGWNGDFGEPWADHVAREIAEVLNA